MAKIDMPCRGTWNLLYQYQRWGETGPSLHSGKQHLPTNSKLNRNERNKYTKYTIKNGYFNQQNLRLTKSDLAPNKLIALWTNPFQKSARWIPDQIETQERVKMCKKTLKPPSGASGYIYLFFNMLISRPHSRSFKFPHPHPHPHPKKKKEKQKLRKHTETTMRQKTMREQTPLPASKFPGLAVTSSFKSIFWSFKWWHTSDFHQAHGSFDFSAKSWFGWLMLVKFG